jgi:hypothetical protein
MHHAPNLVGTEPLCYAFQLWCSAAVVGAHTVGLQHTLPFVNLRVTEEPPLVKVSQGF